ncbi:hypothetical protein JMUB6875_60980 [Nocardia sp. JMUB6875]
MAEPKHAHTLLPSIQVVWSPEQAAFVATSPRCPGMTGTDRWSSLAAVDALIEAAGQRETREPASTGRTAAHSVARME